MEHETTILQRMAAGDAQAADDCQAAYAGLIKAMGRSWFTHPEDVEDLSQDVMIELWRSAHRFDPNIAGEASFVKMITRRQMINRLRRNGKRHDVPLLDGMDFAGEEPVTMEQTLDADRIVGMIAGFRPEQRTVMSLFFKLGMSHGEISEATSIALGTVKSYIRRGVLAVRDGLEPTSAARLSA